MMPFGKADRTRAQFNEPISPSEVNQLASDPDITTLQCIEPVSERTWELLNSRFFTKRPEVELRVYGFYSEECDLSFASRMFNVRHFAADSLMNAINVQHIADIPELQSLSLGVFNLQSFEVLEKVNPGLRTLSIGATKSQKPDLTPLARFRQLRELYIEGQRKNIEAISQLTQLEEVTLRSVTTPTLEYLKPLSNLWSLDIKLGGIRDLTAIGGMERIKYLELWQIRGLSDLHVVSLLPGLQNLFLQSLPRVKALPNLDGSTELRRICIENLKGLEDFKILETAPALEEFLLLDGEAFQPEQLRPVLQNPRLKRAAAYFGSDRKNRRFDELLREYQIEKLERAPFEYRG